MKARAKWVCVTLIGIALPSLLWGLTLDWQWDPEPRWLTGVDAGLGTFFGGIGIGGDFFGSTLDPGEYVSVVIHFDSSQSTICARYERPEYSWVGSGVFQGSAWDISDPGNPRRLNVCFTEWVQSGTYDGTWNVDTTDVGGREYLFVMLSDYNEGVDYNDDNWGPAADVLYGCWLRVIPGHTFMETDPSVLTIFYCEPSGIEPTSWGRIKALHR